MAPAKPEPSAAPLTTAGIQQRIDDERRRLLIEQNLAHSLAGQRLAPLEAGDDEALDRFEAQIAACTERQFRIQERLEILEQRLTEAQERETQANLDAIAARANKAREIGEKLIRSEYRKHAEALASVLSKLHAIDTFIDARNRELERGGHELVSSPNIIRCRHGRHWEETVRKRVGIAEAAHPHHEAYYSAPSLRHESHHDEFVMVNGERVARFVEVETVESRFEPGDFPDPLYACTVPAVGPAPEGEGLTPLWNGRRQEPDAHLLEALQSEIDGDGVMAKAGKSAARLLAAIVPGAGA